MTFVAAAACVPAVEDTSGPAGPGEPAPYDRQGVPAQRQITAPTDGAAPPTAPTPPSTYIADGTRMGIGGCPVYPRNNVFHADISRLPVAANSNATIAAAGADLQLGIGFYAFVWQGSRGGMPINVVDSRTTPLTDVLGGTYGYLSDLYDHPIPPSPKIEGYPGTAWDRHMLVFDVATCVSSEFFYVTPPNLFINQWMAETAVKLDMTSNAIRPKGSATASGTSMLALLIRYDEVAAGRVDHMVGMALPKISDKGPLWPASATDGRSPDPFAPRMGTVLRLRRDADLRGLGRDALVVARALQEHGAIVSDTAGGMGIGGENDPRWNDADLQALTRLEMSDFEVVDTSPMKVRDGSYEIR